MLRFGQSLTAHEAGAAACLVTPEDRKTLSAAELPPSKTAVVLDGLATLQPLHWNAVEFEGEPASAYSRILATFSQGPLVRSSSWKGWPRWAAAPSSPTQHGHCPPLFGISSTCQVGSSGQEAYHCCGQAAKNHSGSLCQIARGAKGTCNCQKGTGQCAH
eukprot:5128116-Amphidinium_carterae.5